MNIPNVVNRLDSVDFDNGKIAQIGRVTNVIGLNVEVSGLLAPLGARCSISSPLGDVIADVIGFKSGLTKLQSLTPASGIKPNSKVKVIAIEAFICVSDELKGKVITPTGEVMIGGPVTNKGSKVPLTSPPLSISKRGLINEQLDTGVKAINGLFPLGIGQRIGLFAGTGVGKSMLLSMITKNTDADVVVIALVGERGREVSEFYFETLDEYSRAKSIIVAAPADTSPIMRMQCAESATAIAESYRDRGLNVLLLVDSVTRYAQAQREVALSNGEPPATKGYPPSVFAKLPTLIERAGKTNTGGSITAIYTVLTEGDDLNDPVADAARGVLDGHIVLSRDIAGRGIYPAIDVTSSISRLSHVLFTSGIIDAVNALKSNFKLLDDNIDLINMGVIERGKNKQLDKAIKNQDVLWDLVKQSPNESFSIHDSIDGVSQTSMKLR